MAGGTEISQLRRTIYVVVNEKYWSLWSSLNTFLTGFPNLVKLLSAVTSQVSSCAGGAQGEHRRCLRFIGFYTEELMFRSFQKEKNILFLHVTVLLAKHLLDPDSFCYLLDTPPLVSVVLGDEEWVWRKNEETLLPIRNRSSIITHSAWLQKLKNVQSDYWWVLTEGEC